MIKLITLYSFISLVLLLNFNSAYSDEATISKTQAKHNLINQANDFATLLNNQEYTKVAFKLNPLIVITMGGISQATDAIEESLKTLNSGSNTFKGLVFKAPDPIVTIANDLVAIVPSKKIIETSDGTFHIDSFYIAWSSDNGKLWYFAEGSGFSSPKSLEFLFPDYNNELKIPIPKRPYKVKSLS